MKTINSLTATDEEIKEYLDNAPTDFVAPELLSKQRLDICNVCPDKINTFGLDSCKGCGCLIKLKVKLSYTKCPIDKW